MVGEPSWRPDVVRLPFMSILLYIPLEGRLRMTCTMCNPTSSRHSFELASTPNDCTNCVRFLSSVCHDRRQSRRSALSAMFQRSDFRLSGPWVIKAMFFDSSVTRDRVFSLRLHPRHVVIAVELKKKLHRLFNFDSNGESALQPRRLIGM